MVNLTLHVISIAQRNTIKEKCLVIDVALSAGF